MGTITRYLKVAHETYWLESRMSISVVVLWAFVPLLPSPRPFSWIHFLFFYFLGQTVTTKERKKSQIEKERLVLFLPLLQLTPLFPHLTLPSSLSFASPFCHLTIPK